MKSSAGSVLGSAPALSSALSPCETLLMDSKAQPIQSYGAFLYSIPLFAHRWRSRRPETTGQKTPKPLTLSAAYCLTSGSHARRWFPTRRLLLLTGLVSVWGHCFPMTHRRHRSDKTTNCFRRVLARLTSLRGPSKMARVRNLYDGLVYRTDGIFVIISYYYHW